MKKYLLLASALVLGLTSCQKGEKTITYHDETLGYYVLSEGTANKGDSQLAFYNYATNTLDNDYFGTKNDGEKLGDTATDIIVYGSKTYIVVNISNKVTVLNSYTGRKIKDIDFGSVTIKDKATPANPRYSVGTAGKVFVSTWHNGLAVIDTTTLVITKNIALSEKFSEGLAEKDGEIYVANSGIEGDSYGGAGTTISIVSVSEEKETGTIKVLQNPNRLAFAKDGSLYCSSWGDWAKIDMTLQKINIGTKQVVNTFKDFAAKSIAVTSTDVYSCAFSYLSYNTYFTKTKISDNTTTKALEPEDYSFRSIYEVCVDPKTEYVYWLDESGLVVIFDKDGKYISELPGKKTEGGIYTRPNKVVSLTLCFPDVEK